jgi:hypothetical protein
MGLVVVGSDHFLGILASLRLGYQNFIGFLGVVRLVFLAMVLLLL